MKRGIRMNEVLKAIKERRSYRKFTDQKVARDLLNQIIEAGLYAPSSMGRQASKFLVIEDEKILQEFSRLNAAVMQKEGDPFYGAKTMIVVLADADNSKPVEDGSLAMQNMMLAAHSLGLGTCWIHRAKEVMESEYAKKLISKAFGEGNYQGIAHLIIGYPDQEVVCAAREEGRVAYF